MVEAIVEGVGEVVVLLEVAQEVVVPLAEDVEEEQRAAQRR